MALPLLLLVPSLRPAWTPVGATEEQPRPDWRRWPTRGGRCGGNGASRIGTPWRFDDWRGLLWGRLVDGSKVRQDACQGRCTRCTRCTISLSIFHMYTHNFYLSGGN